MFYLTFDKDEYEKCQDIDECVDKTHDCNHEGGALCKNEDGSYHCECAAGFSILPDGSCTDINECKSHSACRENAICKNTDGDYECECIKGTVFILWLSYDRLNSEIKKSLILPKPTQLKPSQTPTQKLKSGFFGDGLKGNWFEFGIVLNDF